MRCLLTGPNMFDARVAIAREKSRCCSCSQSNVDAVACILCGCAQHTAGTVQQANKIMGFCRGVRHGVVPRCLTLNIPPEVALSLIATSHFASQPSGSESHGHCVMAAPSPPRCSAAWRVEAPLFAVSLYGGPCNLRSILLDV